MLFHASAILKDREGKPYRDPKPGEEAKTHRMLPNGQMAPHYEDSQKRDMLFGHLAIQALDATIGSDSKDMQADPAKWVSKIMEREETASAIRAALDGDGWVDLKKDQRDMVAERLAQTVTMINLGNAAIGQVVWALQHPAAKKPEAKPAAVANGHAALANDAEPASAPTA
jgi:hypothetical protein